MTNQLTPFENKYLALMSAIAFTAQQEKEIVAKNKELKADLERAMDEYDIKSIDNQLLKITRVAASSSTTVDVKTLKEKEPDLYGELIEDYPKVTNKKAYVKFTVK
ncbi:hypothetical protein MHI57_09790 [Cytobacillus sp. FSL K6-0129]|uniref:hypothetical protein n=1 Tax=Cytobacillus sp. FSL K6-0129 TaxID=2921421 RepID=UPI0030FADCCF